MLGAMVTVAEILSLPVVQRARPEVLVGPTDRVVRWVHTSEIFDIGPLLEGGELLLTTGLGLVREPVPRIRDYVRQIAQRHASGLILELGRTYSEPPQALIDEAAAHDLTFAVFHDVVPWVQVTEAAHRLIVNARVLELEEANSLQQMLADAIAACTDHESLVRAIAEVLHCPTGIEFVDGTTMWSQGAELGEPVQRLPIGAPASSSASFIVPEGAVTQSVSTALTGLLDVWWMRDPNADVISPTASRMRLAQILEGAPDLDARHRRILIDLGLEPQRTRPTYCYAIFARSGTVAPRHAERAAREHFHAAAAVETEQSVLLLTREKVNRSADGLEILAPIARRLREGELDVIIVEGEPQQTLTGLGREIEDLLLLASNPQVRRTRQAYILRQDTNLLRLLSHLDDVGRAERFVAQELAPVLAHDAARRPPLMPTLLALLSTDSKGEAAAAQGISRQAMHARIRMLEDILDTGAQAPLARRAAVMLAALIWQWRTTGSL